MQKYTPNFQGEKWQDIVSMNDAKLQDMGVAALGARRKLLKVCVLSLLIATLVLSLLIYYKFRDRYLQT
jgi:Na+/serine symporter